MCVLGVAAVLAAAAGVEDFGVHGAQGIDVGQALWQRSRGVRDTGAFDAGFWV